MTFKAVRTNIQSIRRSRHPQRCNFLCRCVNSITWYVRPSSYRRLCSRNLHTKTGDRPACLPRRLRIFTFIVH